MKTVIVSGVAVNTYEDEAKHWKEMYEREVKENLRLHKQIKDLESTISNK